MLRDGILEKVRAKMDSGALERYAAEIAEHKRDPYSLVEELMNQIVGKRERV
jgi:hypothetical protein